MNLFIKCICAVTFLNLFTCTLVGVLDANHLDEFGKLVYIVISRRIRNLRSGDIFVNFVRDVLDLLTSSRFPRKKLKRYFSMVSEEVDRFDYKYTRKLSKYFRHLSKTDKEEIQSDMRSYREELDKKPPHLTAFLEAMNVACTVELSVWFRDYVYDLKDYSTDDKLSVRGATRSVLNMILKSVKELRMKDQNDLEKKMKKAVKENSQGDDLELQSLLNSTNSLHSLFQEGIQEMRNALG